MSALQTPQQQPQADNIGGAIEDVADVFKEPAHPLLLEAFDGCVKGTAKCNKKGQAKPKGLCLGTKTYRIKAGKVRLPFQPVPLSLFACLTGSVFLV